MEKFVIKVTVYRSSDPDLCESLASVPLRHRSTVIRRLWRKGLLVESHAAIVTGAIKEREPGLERATPPQGKDASTAVSKANSSFQQELDMQHLQGLSAFD